MVRTNNDYFSLQTLRQSLTNILTGISTWSHSTQATPIMNPQQVGAMGDSMGKFFIGYDQLLAHCSKLYPNGWTKLFKPLNSFWLNGTDPLDYIYVFKNEGNLSSGVPRHWHYIGFGLSDIRGYSRLRQKRKMMIEENPTYEKMLKPLPEVYPQPPPNVKMNGFGIELTLRVKCNSDQDWDGEPPTWPQRLLQNLAWYVFRSRNIFSDIDHVACYSPLDSDGEAENSRIEHILMTLDPQLGNLDTALGPVKFIQIVGVCKEELQAAREWNVRGIREMLKEHDDTGGPFLVTDMLRGETIFDLDLGKRQQLKESIKQMGSNMAQITATNKTSVKKPDWFTTVESLQQDDIKTDHLNQNELAIEFSQPDSNLNNGKDEQFMRPPTRMSLGSESALKIENAEMYDVRYHDRVYILLSLESAKKLPLMLNGRLSYKRPFSFQCISGKSTITFQPEGCPAPSMVNPEHPFMQVSHWLQIYVPDTLLEQMSADIASDFSQQTNGKLTLPKNYSWPDFNLYLTVVEEISDE